jgi:HEAT repeat protein
VCAQFGEEEDRSKDVASLVSALKNRDWEVRRKAARQLGEIADPVAFEPLVKALGDKDKSVRGAAVEALGKIGDIRAIDPVTKKLKDKEVSVRKEATRALGRIGGPRAAEALFSALEDTTPDDSIVLLMQMSPSDQLELNLRERNSDVRMEAVETLLELDGVAVDSPLEALSSKDSTLRRKGALYLTKAHDPDATELLIDSLNHKDWFTRTAVSKALGQSRDTSAIGPLVQALDDKDGEVRVQAARALSELGKTESTLIVEASRHHSLRVRRGAAYALAGMKDPMLKAHLAQALGDNDSIVRAASLLGLGELEDPDSVESLLKALGDEEALVRRIAAAGLGKHKDERTARAVIQNIGAKALIEDLEVYRTIEAMGEAAVMPLVEQLNNPDIRIRGRVASLLGILNDPRAIDPLIQALADKEKEFREDVIEALCDIGAPAIGPLEEAMNHQNSEIRGGAEAALKKIKAA